MRKACLCCRGGPAAAEDVSEAFAGRMSGRAPQEAVQPGMLPGGEGNRLTEDSGIGQERKRKSMGAARIGGRGTGDGGRRKLGIAGLLVLVTTLAFFGCGYRAEPGVEERTGTERPVGKEEGKEDGAAEGAAEKEAETEGNGEAAAEEPEETVSPWSGKTVSICGDSLSTFSGYVPDNYSVFYPEYGDIRTVEETWWMQTLARSGMELCSNASYSGGTVSGQSQDNHDGAYACGNQRIADLAGEGGDWPDVILILMGANDLLNSIPIGGYDGVSQVQEGYIQTFSEAYGLMLDKMRRWYPEAEIYCCTILEVSRWEEAGETFPFRNEHGLTAKNYNDCIKAVAHAKGAAVIDVYGCGITYANAMEYTTDGTHPNAAGAALIADKVCEGLGMDTGEGQ